MKTGKTLLLVSLVIIFTLICVGSAIGEEKKVKKHQIVRIHYLGGITPSELTVEPGTTVVWVNDARAPLEIQFEGNQVTAACKSPVHFIVDENASFISDRISQGSVASLCFVDKGEFNYVARKIHMGTSSMDHRANIKEFKGKVTVK
jgi:plastocyanin